MNQNTVNHITRSRHTTRLDEERRIVYGEVYVPFDPEATAVYPWAEVEARTDTYNTFMRSVTLERLAHQYLKFMRNVDVQHTRDARMGTPVVWDWLAADVRCSMQENR